MSPYLKRVKVGFIGSGNMTKSIVSGLVRANSNKDKNTVNEDTGEDFKISKNFYVSSRTEERAKSISKKYDVHFAKHNDEILEECDWVVLSMKPQDLPEFLNSYGKSFDENHSVISLCAGISTDSLKKELPQIKNLARLMPSTAAEFGGGVLGLYSESESFTQDLVQYFKSVGSVQVVQSEEFLDGIMITAASGIGFLLEVLQIWSEWLEDLGFSKAQSEEIAKQGFNGVSDILKSSKKDIYQLQAEVISKKGVTLAGLEAMRSSDLDMALNKGFEAALRRSHELSKLV